MKKTFSLLICLFLLFGFAGGALGDAMYTGDPSLFAGEWVSGRAWMTLTPSEDGYRCEIRWGSSAWEISEWTYEDVRYDEVAGRLICEGRGTRRDVTYGEDGSPVSAVEVFTDGSAAFWFDDAGLLNWEDFKEAPGTIVTFEEPFSLPSVANPWTDADAESVETVIGVRFGVPEGAENVAYRMLESEQLAEMDFTLDGMEYTARIRPSAEFEDISGMYFDWGEADESFRIGPCAAREVRAEDDVYGTVDLCLWFDAVPGIMYSLSTSGADLDGFDITAIAERVYVPMQGDA